MPPLVLIHIDIGEQSAVRRDRRPLRMPISQPFRGAASRRGSPDVDVIHSETGTLLIDYPPAVRRRIGQNIFDAARDLRGVAPVNLHAPDVEGSRAI